MTERAIATEQCCIAIVGGGSAGLALAAEARRLGAKNVVVLEREQSAGGVPRHCGHYPFGLREYGRLMKGPDYARRNVAAACAVGVDLRTGATVSRLLPGGGLEVVQDGYAYTVRAERVVLCTGVREASRAQRMISGDRPSGIVTTGALQGMVYLAGQAPFRRPIILGSELVSYSAIQTCAHLGIRPVAMVEEEPNTLAPGQLQLYLRLRGVPLHTGVSDLAIRGKGRVEAVSFTDMTGQRLAIETDGVIISGRFLPESALLRASHLEVDPLSGGPVTDQHGRCSDPAFFAAGNLLRPAETSGFCWREGRRAAAHVVADLARPRDMDRHTVAIRAEDPAIGFVSPQRVVIGRESSASGPLHVGLALPLNGVLQATSAGRVLWSGAGKARPVRRVHLPLDKILAARPEADIVVSRVEVR
ncbi:NAD(P)/FAD-dependent oxidoreductase [Salipiger mangrovisoli]|uniref:NAD(P)/FAD-dependent oxidoreductase n=1 Tax=Salipiger mangrovisoli TaxID=2865933 RepID=A0ABR9X5N3_9RHOB|nr:FAD/NAD(P)-binding oxidoreductase [Salipiger mangrovisoli]MBE9638847.1 NAD(P)/FAD-dependent oxidoreductase [Salipiger mangrovisoli]